MPWEYTDKTVELFMAAVQGKPGTHLGEVEDPDGIGEHGSIVCGDALRFTFKAERHPTDPRQDRIVQARYMTFGCTSAIASSEALCAILEERRLTPIQALGLTNQDIVDYLGGLPSQKIHCSVMGADALHAAVFDWARKRGVDLRELGVDITPEEQEEGRIVCRCFSLTEPYLKRKIRELKLRTIQDVINATKAGGACGSCHHAPGGLQDLLDEVWGAQSPPHRRPEFQEGLSAGVDGLRSRPAISPYQFMKNVEKLIEEYVRPGLRKDGGDIEIVDIKDNLVYVRLKGACVGCLGSSMTLKLAVERVLKEKLDENIRVIAV